MNKYFSFSFIVIYFLLLFSRGDKIRFLKVEHPNVTFINAKYVGYLNQTVHRYNRRDPVYYHDLHFEALVSMDNWLKIEFFFFEWLTNQYKPTFVEMRFRWCDLILKDKFFGAAMKQGKLAKPCPHPPGIYHLYNMTVPGAAIPGSFPFSRGRIYCNLTDSRNHQFVAALYINMEIKIVNRKN
ncbi:hypothetical protein O0L34_g10451 [Tuta absoluta]|nr:hypothetical protein O0L34_g10451 [Tuta absoluta]